MISKKVTATTAGWMLDLDLTDKQEKLYALIYSKTDAGGRWTMTAKDVATWCRCSERHAQRLIRELEDMGLIAHEVVTWKSGKVGGTKTEFWAIDPEDATPAPSGSKTKITWRGNRTPHDTDVVTPLTTQMSLPPHDTDVVTPHIDSNNNKHTTSNTFGANTTSREDAPSASAPFVPPTVEEVTAYARAQGFADPEGFADYYVRYQTEAEWMTGKGKQRHQITNWKLNVIQWSQYRKNQIFNRPSPERAREAAAPDRRPAKRTVVIPDDDPRLQF